MGVLDSFLGKSRKNKNKKGKTKQESLFLKYSGTRVEVMSRTDELLIVAILRVIRDDMAELTPILPVTFTAKEGEFFPVKLRFYEQQEQAAVQMNASIALQPDLTWRVTNLSVAEKNNERSAFRQDASARGEVKPIGKPEALTQPFTLQNISAGGVCIRTEGLYVRGERLTIRLKLLPDRPISELQCQVRRVTERGGGYEYGCEFINLKGSEESEIMRAIMEMQRKRR